MTGGGSRTRVRTDRRTGSVWVVPLLLTGLLLLTAPLAVARAPTAHVVGASSIGVSLVAQPINGTAPLVVQLRATVTPTSLSGTFRWTFGDGGTYQESATSYSAIAHSYQLPGSYTANVSVVTSQGDGNASVVVRVGSSNLSAQISASPVEGPAPLTVHFVTDISGGTGTYTAILWRFGDGGNGSGSDLLYTYVTVGTYVVRLNVSDTSGVTATTSIEVIVTAGSAKTSGDGPAFPSYLDVLLPIALVLAAVAVAAVAYRGWLVRRTAAAASSPASPPVTGAASDAGPAGAASGPATPEAMAEAVSSRPGGEDSRKLSERILVHLYWYGRPTADGVARPDSSQAGMARRLGVAQNAISKSLGRLMDSGAVRMELRHVPGASRRLRTYTLTPRGEAVARSIRAEPEPRVPP